LPALPYKPLDLNYDELDKAIAETNMAIARMQQFYTHA